MAWGALWGMAAGFWLFLPPLLRIYDLHPESVGQWLLVDVALGLEFAFGGALLAFYGFFALEAWERYRRRPFANPAWLYRLSVPALLAATYLLLALGVDAGCTRLRGFDDPRAALGPGAIAYLLLALGCLVVYRATSSRRTRGDARALALAMWTAILLGAAILPWRVGPAPVRVAAEDVRPTPRGARPRAPLLFVGIDGGSWRALTPLLEQRRLPLMGRLVSDGIHGDMAAPWPPFWSAPAWAAILTGFPREESGVYEDLMVKVPGLPPFERYLNSAFLLYPISSPISSQLAGLERWGVAEFSPPPRSAIHRPPFWELLSVAGVKTGVVRFRFTYPAAEQAEVVVSDWIGRDLWDMIGVRKQVSPRVVSPAALAPAVVAALDDHEPVDAIDIKEILPEGSWPRPADSYIDPLSLVRVSLDIDRRTLAATELVLRSRPDLEVVAVYIGGFDGVCHALWQYRFPDDFAREPPARRDVEVLGPVVDRYLEFLDRSLGRIAAAFPRTPNVVVVSDHGFEAIHTHHLYKGWHGSSGIFLAAGPDVPRRTASARVSYVDVVPTVLALTGLEKPDGMPGAPLVRLPD